ncbi:MAG: SusD/RagB family nutrient-binding outer membrane lipoprotein [Chitinophagaceae bacterium]
MKFKILYIVGFLFMVGTGCKKSFLDINTNPNVLPTATPSYVITNAMNVSASNQVNPNEIGSYWGGQWTQSGGYILNTQQFVYQYTDGDFNYWDGIYDNLYDYQYVLNNADAYDQKYLKGPARVMQSLLYQYLVDMYGNVPYSDALKATGSLAPAFDEQKDVYANINKQLDTAIAELKANDFASAFTGADIVFYGNTTKWAQFANSLKLRILIHQAKVSGMDSYITAEINKIITEGSGFITGEEAGIGGSKFFLATAGKLNPVYDKWGYDANGAKRALNNYPRLTKFLVDGLIATNDTFRLKRIGYAIGGENSATPGISVNAEVAGNYVGIPFGAPAFLPAGTSSLGPSLLVKGEYNRPFILLTAAEVQFLLAEAKQRYGGSVNLPGTAQSYYEEGVKQSFRVLGANVGKATELLTSGIADADWSASPNKLNAIAYQKWIALCNFNGLEAWTEYRRTNYPVTPQAQTVTSADRPLRLFYPSTEKGSNPNVTEQGTIDVFATKLFWDVD